MFAKPPSISDIEVYNDVDSNLVSFFRVLQDETKFNEFHRKLKLSPYSRENYNLFSDTWHQQEDEVERAYRWFVVMRQSFSGRFDAGWGFGVTSRSWSKIFKSVVDRLPEVVDRWRNVQVENKDWKDIIETYDHKDAFLYLDPPYILSTRRAGGYACEMSDEDHMLLVERVQALKGRVLLSGYNHPIYDSLPWNKEEFEVVSPAAGKTRASGLQGKGKGKELQTRTECLWSNYETDLQISLF